MKILIAPDKFKGSLAAEAVCEALTSGLLQADTTLTITKLPLADGGEGTCVLLTDHDHGDRISVVVHDPLFRRITSGYGISKDRETAFIEMAMASGLALLKKEEQNPLVTSSVGTGELIRHALDLGVSTIILGIGGSATNDAGAGMAEALGVIFYAVDGTPLKPVGENLTKVHAVDCTNLHPRCAAVKLIVLCDVDSPLYGPHGAACTFGPQKGANAEAVMLLDDGLRHFGAVLHKQFGVDIEFQGAGAAGGIAVMFRAIMGQTSIQAGMEFIATRTKLAAFVQDADVIITGEGRLDHQSFSGKVIGGVRAFASRYKKPVIVVAGECELAPDALDAAGISHCFTLVTEAVTRNDAVTHAFTAVQKIALEHVFPVLATVASGTGPGQG